MPLLRHVPTYIAVTVTGIVSTLVFLLFDQFIESIQWLFSGVRAASRVEAFINLPFPLKVSVPLLGGFICGIILRWVNSRSRRKPINYNEVLRAPNRPIPTRSSLIKILAETISIATGSAIGKIGTTIQAGAILLSWFSQTLKLSPETHRLLIAGCVASGFSFAFQAPIAGVLFALESMGGALSLRLLTLLLTSSLASCSFLQWLGIGAFSLESDSFPSIGSIEELLLCPVLGILIFLVAQCWRYLLTLSGTLLKSTTLRLPIQLALAGSIVGVGSCFSPGIISNGEELLFQLSRGDLTPSALLFILLIKGIIISALLECSALGGMITPTLLIGAILGFLFGIVLNQHDYCHQKELTFALVGMVTFFAAVTNTPLASLCLALEMSHTSEILVPCLATIGVILLLHQRLRLGGDAEDALNKLSSARSYYTQD